MPTPLALVSIGHLFEIDLAEANNYTRIGVSRIGLDGSPTSDTFMSNSHQNSIGAIYRSSAGSLLIPPTPTRSLGPNTPRSPSTREDSFRSHSREQSIDDRTSISSISGTPSHSHWCTVCKSKHFSTCDGWKRHMKEHETCYPCVLCGPASTLGKDKKFSRKSNLEKHLRENHGESGARADQWRQTVPKKAYACGFCVAYFRTLQDQMNHIDNLHYKHSQDIKEWDHNNVILGLLSQPDVKVAWQKELASNGISASDCTWQNSADADLQTMLEMRQDSPDALAAEALRSTDQYKKVADENQSTSTLDPMDQDMATAPQFPQAQPQYQAAGEFAPASLYYNGMPPSNASYPAETLQSTSQTMMSGQNLGHSHTRSSSSAMSDPFIDNQPVNPYQSNIMPQPNIMHPYQDSTSSFQPSSASANTSNMTNIPFPFQPSENNNLSGIGGWQEPETSDPPVTPSASGIFGYRAYQSNHPEAPDPTMTTAYPSTNNAFNPQDNASDRWPNFPYPMTPNEIPLPTSQDDDNDESHVQTGYNYRPRSRRT